MKKIAVFEVEYETDDMYDEEDLKNYNSELEIMQELYENDNIGIFDEEIKLVDIKEVENEKVP